MKIVNSISALALLFASVVSANAQQGGRRALVVTASNAASNQLLVYDTSGKLVQTVATGGQGGASGNSGGIATWRGRRVAAVNFGSQTVAILDKNDDGFQLKQVVSAASSPLSVAFGHGHLYILGATTIESHQVFDWGVSPGPDGMASLVKADGSAAQVGVLGNELIISEKSNVIETVNLKGDGAIVGAPSTVANIPANVDAPFGLVTRGNDAWVTIAHADEISLVRKDAVVTVTGSGTQHAPCWLALDGPYLFSSNSPSKSISRYLVFGKKRSSSRSRLLQPSMAVPQISRTLADSSPLSMAPGPSHTFQSLKSMAMETSVCVQPPPSTAQPTELPSLAMTTKKRMSGWRGFPRTRESTPLRMRQA